LTTFILITYFWHFSGYYRKSRIEKIKSWNNYFEEEVEEISLA